MSQCWRQAFVDCVWNVTAQAQKPDFVFRRKVRVHLNRRGRQFSRLLAAEVCASAVVVLDTTCSEVVWRVLATHSIPQFPLQFPSRASPCVNTFQRDSTYTRVFPATVVTAIQFCQLNIYAHELQRSRDLVAVIVTTFCVGDSGIAVWLPADASVSRAHSVSKWTGNAGSSPEI